MSDVVDLLRKLSSKLKDVDVLADKLERIGSIDNAGKEAEARLENYKLEEKKHLNEISKLKSEQDSLLEKIDKSNELAQSIVDAARLNGAKIMQEYSDKGEKIYADFEKKKADVVFEIEKLKSELQNLKSEFNKENELYVGLQNKMKEIKAQLASVFK